MQFDTDNAEAQVKRGWNSFKSSMKSLGNNTLKMSKKLAPASMSDEKGYAKSLCLMGALIVTADKEVNDDEVSAVSNIFDINRQCREYMTTESCHDVYLEALGELAYVQDNPVLFLSTQNAIIAEIKELVPAANSEEFLGLAMTVATASGEVIGEPENVLYQKLQAACA